MLLQLALNKNKTNKLLESLGLLAMRRGGMSWGYTRTGLRPVESIY